MEPDRRNYRNLSGLLIAALLAAVPGLASAQDTPKGSDERPTRREVWDIALGTKIAELPDDFMDYACGTNGGPPSTPLTGWKDYRRCRPEPSGLREVYFRYDDELEYWAKANNLTAQMEQYVGTKTYGFPITVSVLFADDGIVRGVRIVTDPRDPTGDRDEAYLLRNFLNARFGREGWTCDDQAADSGRAHIMRRIKQRRNWSHMVQPLVLPDPPEFRSANDKFGLCSRFMKQGSRFQRTFKTSARLFYLGHVGLHVHLIGKRFREAG